jgi:predicted RNA-binding Zn-ribbon protein involved in translation (DUF1610 family)
MTRKYICPKCGEKTGVRIAYGYPSEKMIAKEEMGEIALGGCVIEPNQPERRCTSCEAEWNIKRKLTKFEIARQKWLEEDVKGRSWTEMMDDKDKADNEKAKALMTPEYLAMWKKAEKDYDADPE